MAEEEARGGDVPVTGMSVIERLACIPRRHSAGGDGLDQAMATTIDAAASTERIPITVPASSPRAIPRNAIRASRAKSFRVTNA